MGQPAGCRWPGRRGCREQNQPLACDTSETVLTGVSGGSLLPTMTVVVMRNAVMRLILRSIHPLVLFVLLAALSGGAQTPVSVPSSHQDSVRIRYVEPLELVLDEPLSSATAKQGQTVRMELKEPWVAEGHFIAPAGTPAVGTVRRVERAIPGKRNGRVVITAGSIQLPSGKSVRLNIQMPDASDCDDPGPCILVASIFAVVEAPLLAIELPVAIVQLPKAMKKEREERQAIDIPSEESNLPAGSKVNASNKWPFRLHSSAAGQ